MDRDKLIQRLRATFSSELREHVEAFNRELLSLERGGTEASRADSIKTLFRTAHSLKGAARAVSASKLELVCHNLEELLQSLRDGSRQLTPEVFETLFAAVDTFEEAGREISASLPPSDNPARPRPTPHPPSSRAGAARGPVPAGGAPQGGAPQGGAPQGGAPPGSASPTPGAQHPGGWPGSAPPAAAEDRAGTAPGSAPPAAAAWQPGARSGASPTAAGAAHGAPPRAAPPGTALPGTALPGTAPPGTAPPGTAPPGTTLPGTALPGTAGGAPHAATLGSAPPSGAEAQATALRWAPPPTAAEAHATAPYAPTAPYAATTPGNAPPSAGQPQAATHQAAPPQWAPPPTAAEAQATAPYAPTTPGAPPSAGQSQAATYQAALPQWAPPPTAGEAQATAPYAPTAPHAPAAYAPTPSNAPPTAAGQPSPPYAATPSWAPASPAGSHPSTAPDAPPTAPTQRPSAAASAFNSVRPVPPEAELAPPRAPTAEPAPGTAATTTPAATATLGDAMTVPHTPAASDTTSAGSSSSIPPAASRTNVPALAAPPHVSTLPPQSLQAGLAHESSATSIAHETFLRVPEHKLDSLLAASSELLIARRRIDARHSQLHALCDRVAELRTSWDRTARSSGNAVRTAVRQPGNVAMRIERHAAHAIDADRDQLANIERALESYASAFADDMRALERAAEALDERIHQVRMLPFVQACDALHRAVRDLASRERKPTQLVIRGGEIELDRSIVDGLRAPLLHLVRNAIDHGIETADERSSSGKPPRATLTIAAALRGDRVEVSVRDDGRGIDLERIRERIRLNGLPPPVDDQDALRMIFEAGFSTAPTVTDVSGRGVGLDVVRTQIEGMRGSVTVSFESGRYTCFTLTLPLTVTTLRALLMRSGSEVFALPSTAVEKLVRASADELTQLQGRESLLRDGTPLPLVSLAEIIGSDTAPPSAAQSKLPVVILGQPGERVALAVDELIAEQDVVIKPLGKRIRKLRHVSGATLLPSGRIALLLHAGEVLRTALGRVPARRAGGMFQPSLAPTRKRLLLVDDSATTRTLERSILEAAGYEVLTAVDGAQGWELLKEQGADLIVSDVEMPNMSGFELTQAIRTSKRFRDTPVILLTSLDSEQDRARGLESGADAYLVKSAFDQTNLLETIRQLL